MSKTYTFRSRLNLGAELPSFSQTEIKNEPMLFACDIEHAAEFGGVITDAFMAALVADGWDDAVIDTRSHMLMPGWFPAIPGWHHDDVPRGTDGQPIYDDTPYFSDHAMALVNGDICPTMFAVGDVKLPAPAPYRGPTYGQWHPMVDIAIQDGILRPESAPSNRIIYFDWQTFHQGVAANAGGWRWFGRASRNTAREPANEVRRQVQVYLAHPMEGW